ncbi:MAG: rod shape-determining protein RodA [Chlamydiia bacterium]|nr:rod shape-determining protein RodA [Chlamydiia bacterium]
MSGQIFQWRSLRYLDWRIIFIIIGLMLVSLITLASASPQPLRDASEETIWTPVVLSQLRWFFLGSICYLCAATFNYHKLREWTWFLYLFTLIALLGLFFVPAIQNVHRWYRIPGLNYSFQPSEYAKLAVVIALSWYIERRRPMERSFSTAIGALAISLIPFLLILKQPDLGTALVLLPISLVIFYLGGIHPFVVRVGLSALCIALGVVSMVFSGIISHEMLRPYATQYIREYQYERLNPNLHHQRASTTAIALGGVTGQGWFQGEFSRHGWLPAPYTDSVFPAFAEEFGMVGLITLLSLFYALIYYCFQAAIVAKDAFGRLLAAGISVYLAVHVLLNVGMMCQLFPVTGVPLILISYGGSSILSTMIALGIIQSIYARRFTF